MLSIVVPADAGTQPLCSPRSRDGRPTWPLNPPHSALNASPEARSNTSRWLDDPAPGEKSAIAVVKNAPCATAHANAGTHRHRIAPRIRRAWRFFRHRRHRTRRRKRQARGRVRTIHESHCCSDLAAALTHAADAWLHAHDMEPDYNQGHGSIKVQMFRFAADRPWYRRWSRLGTN